MRRARKAGTVCLALLLASGWLFGQSSAGVRTKATASASLKPPSVVSRLEVMEKALEAQQREILQLQDQLKNRDSQVQELQQQLAQTQAAVSQAEQAAQTAQAALAKDPPPAVDLDVVKNDVDDLKTSATSAAQSLQALQKQVNGMESPMAMHFKGITVTPGGFLAAESVYRTRALGADINTPLNGLLMPGSGQNALSEFYASGRQSRVTMLAEGKLSEAKLSGYYEADFLSAAATSNNNESNSYSLRQRQVWGQLAVHDWTLTGGQMWSLVTETKKGVDNRTEAMPITIDAQYHVGFSWARQFGFRVAKNFGNRVWLAGSVENPQTTFAAHNNGANFAFGSLGNSGGLYNAFNGTYSFNAAPDVVLKAVFEPGFGHYEIFGLYSRFRDRAYPCGEISAVNNLACGGTATTTAAPSALNAYNSSRNGGGVGANARITIAKHVDFGLHALTGNGVGRYGSSTLPDATVNPDGTLALLRSYQGLATLEWHSRKLDVYLNGGEEYIGRHYLTDPVSGKSVGYGSPALATGGCYTETVPGSNNGFTFGSLGSCTADTKYVLEGTIGFWVKVYNGSRGRIQFGPQYSYLSRNLWTGTLSASAGTFSAPHGVDNMVFTSFRYYLP